MNEYEPMSKGAQETRAKAAVAAVVVIVVVVVFVWMECDRKLRGWGRRVVVGIFETKVDEMNSIEVDFRKDEDRNCYQLIQKVRHSPALFAATFSCITITN